MGNAREQEMEVSVYVVYSVWISETCPVNFGISERSGFSVKSEFSHRSMRGA